MTRTLPLIDELEAALSAGGDSRRVEMLSRITDLFVGAAERYSEEQVRDNIFKVVKDLEIPVKREEIKVVSNQDVVKISMDYTVPVDLLVYQLNLHFTPSSENKNL